MSLTRREGDGVKETNRKEGMEGGTAQCFSLQFRACVSLVGILLIGQGLTQWGCGGS